MLKPLFARVLLERVREEKTEGGIIIPDDVQRRHSKNRCTVVAVGPNCDETVQVGQTVVVGRHAGDWTNEEGVPGVPPPEVKEWFICQDEDILFVVEDDG